MLSKPYRGCVYLATNTINSKIYIGKSTWGIKSRMGTHRRAVASGGRTPFTCALRKYGYEAFHWQVIFASDDDALLLKAEVELIADYRAAGFTMYNVTAGGEGTAGRTLSEAQLAKMRQPRSEQAKANMRAANTPAVNQRRSAALKGRIKSEETRLKSREARLGVKLSEDHCKAIGDGRRGIKMKPWSDERRAKVAAAWEVKRASGWTPTEETRAKQSAAAMARSDDGHRSRAGKLGAKARWG